jgi:hypothetical protein
MATAMKQKSLREHKISIPAFIADLEMLDLDFLSRCNLSRYFDVAVDVIEAWVRKENAEANGDAQNVCIATRMQYGIRVMRGGGGRAFVCACVRAVTSHGLVRPAIISRLGECDDPSLSALSCLRWLVSS